MDRMDVVIVGGGAAGLSAALVLLRARRTVVVIDAGAPRNAPAAHMHGYLSRDGMTPAALLEAGREEISRYGGSIIDGTVARIAPGFDIRLTDGRELTARRVLVSTGLRDEIPDIPGVRERWGRDVLHCPYCHGYEVRDQPLGVLGGTAESVGHALLIAQWSDDVVYFPHTHSLTDSENELLAARGIRIVRGRVSEVVVDSDAVQGIELDDGTRVPRSAHFVRPRMRPNDALFAELGCETDERGWVRIDAGGQTTVDGLYAAGNAADPRAQVITAAGQGSATAIAINAALVNDDVAAQLAAHRRR
jgi:thioredoxin reductase